MLVLLAAVGCGREKEVVVARVNNRPITQRALWRALEIERDGQAGKTALDRLIVQELIRQDANQRGVEVTREELESRIDALRDYRLAYSGKDFDAWLADTGQTEQDIASALTIQMLTAKLVLSDEDRRQYFEEHREELADLPHNNESVIFRRIVVATKDEAEAIRRELTAGTDTGEPADFAEIAEARSLDPVGRSRGGMVGWMIKGKSDDPELEKVAFSLKEGEISEPAPVKLPEEPEAEGQEEPEGEQPAQELGQLWQIVRVERYIPPHEVTYEDNADVIEEWMLKEGQYQMQLHEFWNSLRAKADIEIVAPRYTSLGQAYQRGREARERRMAAPSAPLAPVPQQAPEGSPTPP
jgi:parvulin-like peptidyl-prolyl isomerase